MTGRTPRSRDGELLLARISEAAGRERIGRRLATYPGAVRTARPWRAAVAVLCRVTHRAPRAARDARLDLYEHGMTVALNGRIHVVRYATTSVLQDNPDTTRTYTVTDVEGRRLVLHDGSQRGPAGIRARVGFRDARQWGPEVQRAVTAARLPRALAALDRGERLAFGGIWLTGERVGSGRVSAPWPSVQRIAVRDGFVALKTAGTWHTLDAAVSEIPNFFVLRALAERLRTDPTV
ncbi:DUF6585 family protein [Streptantibioticus rubrisoli]|uniref:Uncharacterized protein n=1 Tax=Streptantibioticus rubrisoli TaxID=1387313 RepID=A0ABT1PR24_9ACTN|nr:DUF6585 family protein [Streptantibioticus rubrisoli]MCQ4046695.1 hypothetical protein [Streptantibioticus rubrisoli]